MSSPSWILQMRTSVKFQIKPIVQFIQKKNVANPECLTWPQSKQSSIKFTVSAPFWIIFTCPVCWNKFQHVDPLPHSFLLDVEKKITLYVIYPLSLPRVESSAHWKISIFLYLIVSFRIWLPVFILLDVFPEVSVSLANVLLHLRAVQAHNYPQAWKRSIALRLKVY